MPATLTSLRIRNFALVDDLLWEPEAGFTAITGETGAGKSVLIGALKLLLGERADRALIRSGEETCLVEAVFEGVEDPRVAGLLEEAGVEACEEGRLLLKRSISTTGTGRQFLNGSPCTLGLLRSLGELLVDLHGPHDHQSLFSRDQQTRLLDGFAGLDPQRESFASARRTLTQLEHERDELTAHEQSLARELETLRHQCQEIEAAAPDPAEEEVLLGRHRAAANATRILELCQTLLSRISGEGPSLGDGVAELVRTTRELARLDSSTEGFSAQTADLAEALARLDSGLQAYADSFEADPAALAAIETRLDTLQSLKRKYGATIEEVLAFFHDAAARLTALESRAARSNTLDAEIAAAQDRLSAIGAALTKARLAAAKALEKLVSADLADLGFAKSGFSISWVPSSGPLGNEIAEFLFSPNPGEEPRPLRMIASSGEISRVMLAIKGVLAAQDDVALLVFDEIDANVGGEIAAKVANRLRQLSEGRQVFCITHLPQVAAAASRQFVVNKEMRLERTRTTLTSCEGEARVEELVRMLGGQSPEADAHARALLKSPKPPKPPKPAKPSR